MTSRSLVGNCLEGSGWAIASMQSFPFKEQQFLFWISKDGLKASHTSSWALDTRTRTARKEAGNWNKRELARAFQTRNLKLGFALNWNSALNGKVILVGKDYKNEIMAGSVHLIGVLLGMPVRLRVLAVGRRWIDTQMIAILSSCAVCARLRSQWLQFGGCWLVHSVEALLALEHVSRWWRGAHALCSLNAITVKRADKFCVCNWHFCLYQLLPPCLSLQRNNFEYFE